jgi:hypothetical protein
MKSNNILNILIAGCISSDTCIDINSCEENIKNLEFLKEKLESDFKLEGEEYDKYLEMIENGLSVVKRDLKEFKENEKETND